MKYFWQFPIALALLLPACLSEGTNNSSPVQQEIKPVQPAPKQYSFTSPVPGQTFRPGERLWVSFTYKELREKADSLVIYLDGEKVNVIDNEELSGFEVNTRKLSPGTRNLRYTAFYGTGGTESSSLSLRFFSDLEPVTFRYKVIASFPHDINAYTQGFEYHEGYFLEGTGQYGQSSLRKVVPGTGDIQKSRTLSPDLFGEGITLFDNKIYQLTYRSQVGFIYDAKSFEQERKFFYENREGWGLSNNGKEIIMSDGTNALYFIDPQYFAVNRKIEVCDRISEVDSLNELEYIDGYIYANRYLTDEIVIIDPESGKVTGKVNLKGLLKEGDKHSRIDVLNGIAWDKEDRRLFVTGKYWPKVFHIELEEN